MATARREYEMSQDDLNEIIEAIRKARDTPLLAIQCGMPPSVQEVANAAWAKLGERMGFDHMTVRPDTRGRGDRFFSAEALTKEPTNAE